MSNSGYTMVQTKTYLNLEQHRRTVQSTHPWFMTDRATKGITPAPTSRLLTARFMISTDVTEWNALVAATITMTRMFPVQKRITTTQRWQANVHHKIGSLIISSKSYYTILITISPLVYLFVGYDTNFYVVL